jgi:hypothetical protein
VNRRSLITPFGRVGSGEQHRWHFEAERLRGLEVERRELITPLGGAVAWRSPRKRSSGQNIAHRWVSAISLRQSLMID